MKALRAGAVYFAVVFACAFVLGTIRIFLVIPLVGELPAVLLELPAVLGLSWFAAGRVSQAFGLSKSLSVRLTMGGSAFTLLMVAEFVLGLYGFGRSFDRQIAALMTTAGAIGLAGQVAFALIPAALPRG